LNVFCNIDPKSVLELRKYIISNILFTDIKVHFTLMKDFENVVKVHDNSDNTPLSILSKDKIAFGK